MRRFKQGYLACLILFRPVGIALASRPLLAAVDKSQTHLPNQDLRLNTRTRNSQIGGTVSNYLELLESATNVRHEAFSPFDQRPLTCINVQMSLGQIQRIVARDLKLSWKASKSAAPTYLLYESIADHRLREVGMIAARKSGRDRMKARFQQVRQWAYLPKKELQRLAAAGEAKGRTLQDPRLAAGSQMLFGLPDSIWQTFWTSGTATVKISSLSPELQALAVKAAGTARAGDPGQTYKLSDLVIPKGVVTLQMGGTLEKPTIWGVWEYGNHGKHTNLLDAIGANREPPESRRKAMLRRKSKTPDDARFKLRVSLTDVPRNKKLVLEPGERPTGALPLAEFLRQLGEQTEIPIIAECDHKPKEQAWLEAQWWLAEDIEKLPLAEALDLLCADFEYEWEFYQGSILLRPMNWFAPPDARVYVFPKLERRVPRSD